jgi:APA family basic amino acid/polyamine antiporter
MSDPKPSVQTTDIGETGGLKKSLRFLYVYALATGAILTFMGYWDAVFVQYCGPGTWLGFLLMTIMVLPVAFVYCEMAPHFPTAGGELLYNTVAINKHAGFWSSWLIMAAWITVPTAGTMAIVDWFFLIFKIEGSVQLTSIITVILLVIFCFLSLNDIQIAGKVQTFMLFSALIILVVTGIMFLFHPSWSFDNMRPLFQSILGKAEGEPIAGLNVSGWLIGLGLIVTPYFGFETVPQLVEEGDFPIKSGTKAIWGSVVTCGVLYSFFFFCLAGLGPFDKMIATSPNVVADGSNLKSFIAINWMNNEMGWTFWAYIFGIGAVLFCIGTCILGFWVSGVRLFYAMGSRNFLPQAFAKLNKHAQPIVPNYFLLGFSIVLVLIKSNTSFMNDFFNTMSFGCACCYTLTMIGAIRLRQRYPQWEYPVKLPGGMAFRVLALILAFAIAVLCGIGLTPGSWRAFGIYLLIGAGLWMYMVFVRWKKSNVVVHTIHGDIEG